MKKATLFKKLKDKAIKCTACNHSCIVQNDRTGLCGVRKNIKGDLYLTTYGKVSAINIDPIEKKPLFHFLPGTEAFSIGGVGCNFGCDFCQNWDISQAGKDSSIPLPSLHDLLPEKIVQECKKQGIPTIAYTYNEPAITFEYNFDTAKLASKSNIKNVYVSNGYASKKSIDLISPYLDGINIDLKAFTENFYQELCKAKLKPVLDNIKYYFEKGVWIELTTLIIPGKNDSTKELEQIARFILSISPSIPWHISRFSPTYKMSDASPTPEKTIHKAHKIGKEVGLKYVYTGNIFGEDLHSTYCPKCNDLLIKRDWGYTNVEGLKNGKCDKCKTAIEGVWK